MIDAVLFIPIYLFVFALGLFAGFLIAMGEEEQIEINICIPFKKKKIVCKETK